MSRQAAQRRRPPARGRGGTKPRKAAPVPSPRGGKGRRSPAHRRVPLAAVLISVAIVSLVAAMLLLSRGGSGAKGETLSNAAPDFTLPSTSGQNVSLASYRGRKVVLYFSEGVGCDACFYQMVDLEKNRAQLAKDGITVIPIVMNPVDQVRQEMARFDLKTPFLIDDGSVSNEYGVLGTGMHENLPGHSFVLVDQNGVERWKREYPSMYVSASGLLKDMGPAA